MMFAQVNGCFRPRTSIFAHAGQVYLGLPRGRLPAPPGRQAGIDATTTTGARRGRRLLLQKRHRWVGQLDVRRARPAGTTQANREVDRSRRGEVQHGRIRRQQVGLDDEAVEVTRTFTRLKMRLMPYLADVGEQASATGVPVMRAMALEFPTDRGVAGLGTQYMLGDALLVAPVFSAARDAQVYLPEGEWTHLLTGERVTGRGWRREQHGFDSLPLYVRPGTVLPIGAVNSGPEYAWAEGVTLHLFELPDGYDAVTTVPGGTGTAASFRVVRTGSRVHVTSDDAVGMWSVAVGALGQPVASGPGPGAVTVTGGAQW